MTAGKQPRRRVPSAPIEGGASPVDAASWAAAGSATGTAREQLSYLLGQRDVVNKISRRFGNLGARQREGHVFEWMHEVSFNLNAIANDDEARLQVTTWLGQPHAPADLRLYGPSGQVVAEVQSKVIEGTARRISVDGLTSAKYDGMELLIPSDHVSSSMNLFDQRLAMPEGPLHARYADAKDRLSDHVTHGLTGSDPVSTARLALAAEDPSGHLAKLISHNEMKQLLGAGGAAAATAALVTGVVDLAVHRVSTGSFDDLPWTEIARKAAQVATRSAAVAVAGQVITISAQHASAWGGVAAFDALAGSALPFATARAAFDIAAVAHGWATGRLNSGQAAVATTEILTRSAAVWACAAVGQAAIPIPLVGAFIGAVVGQHGANVLIQGIRLAAAARDRSVKWDTEYEQLLLATDRLRDTAASELAALHEAAAQYHLAFTEAVLPRLDRLSEDFWRVDPDTVLSQLANLAASYAGTPLFTTIAEFDKFMADDSQTLVLDLGGEPRL